MRTRTEPSIVTTLVQRIVDVAVAHGAPRPALLNALGVDERRLADPEARIPARATYAAWEVAMRACRDDGLPMAVASHVSVAGLGLLGYVLYTRPTVESALQAMARYIGVVNDSGQWSIHHGDEETVIVWRRDGDRTLGMRVANEQVLGAFVALGTNTDRGGHSVRRVSFRHPKPRRDDAHVALFGVAPRWGADVDAVVIPREALAAAPVGADALLSEYFAKVADQALARVAGAGTWSAQVARVVSSSLASGIPSAASVARALGTSERTARRRLADEGATFDALVQRVQREQAAELLAGSTPIHDIAFAIGFSDATAFSRAYRRWTGSAPSEARASQR